MGERRKGRSGLDLVPRLRGGRGRGSWGDCLWAGGAESGEGQSSEKGGGGGDQRSGTCCRVGGSSCGDREPRLTAKAPGGPRATRRWGMRASDYGRWKRQGLGMVAFTAAIHHDDHLVPCCTHALNFVLLYKGK
ncbi:hypothetical protein TIFTF001_022832 [Ficus carica]|uniref:Uncharacterized protein n=1 Tax=Ficus carica TaxID=3494 RepID=A0AA88AMJ6_FICCA|nr:hypothetical protein TIFTF001_022832 [Ficus carica]